MSELAAFSIQDLIAPLHTGINVPLRMVMKNPPSDFSLIIGHGLGAKNPEKKNHLNDDWIQILNQPARNAGLSQVSYTARGHGNSTGWQDTSFQDPLQFSWPRLATDMVAVADFCGVQNFIASGSSMGSATALYACLENPERVKAVIMLRPPTAWQTRRDRKKYLLASANKLKEKKSKKKLNSNQNKDNEYDFEDKDEKNEKEENDEDVNVYSQVLRGAAESDLPPLHDLADASGLYASITCPMLILTVEGDSSHPIDTAIALNRLVKHSEMHIAKDEKETEEKWPSIIEDFLRRVSEEKN